ncbi:MAG: glycosyltransferase family 39 protein [bacterium]|nr:glycosyltransferase family 39 protein [bacterium]
MQIQSFINIPKNYKADYYFGLLAVNILGLGCLFGYLNIGDIDTDGGIFAAVAMKDLNGGILYQTAWENKPPGIIYFIEGLFFLIPNKINALFALPILGIVFLVSGLFNLGYKVSKSLLTSILFIALFLLFAINNSTIGDAMYTEIFGSVFLVWGLYFMIKNSESINPKDLNIAALLLGFTFWFKEPFVLIFVPIFIYFFIIVRPLKSKLILFFYALIPSIFFILLLQLNGSLIGFFEMVKYNFSFTESFEGSNVKIEQLNHILYHIIEPLKFLFLAIILNIIRGFRIKGNKWIITLCVFLLLSSLAFILIAPYTFNHYYIPFIILFFVCFILLFKPSKSEYAHTNIWINIVLLITIYSLDSTSSLKLKWKVDQYVPDRISEKLMSQKGATLFVDLVDASGYYVKGNILYPTFMPVPVAAHFGDNTNGLKNLQRIYKELSENKPDFLITEESSSFMYWHIPDKNLYYGNYEKIDSLKANYGKNVILWKLKQH